MMWDGYGTGWMGGMWVFGLLVVIIVALLVLTLMRVRGGEVGGQTHESGGPGHARAILKERYARGEIDTADYEERLRNLERP